MLRVEDESQFVCVRHARTTWRIAQDWTTGRPGWTAIARPAFLAAADHERYASLPFAAKARGAVA